MTRSAVTLVVGDDGVAIITLYNPPVNSLSDHVMMGVISSFKTAHLREDVKAIVLTGAEGKFCGGADIRNLQRQEAPLKPASTNHSEPHPRIIFINEVMEGGPKPAVAAIETFALGGGLELAMACHARLVTPKSRLGLPELQLGIIPGYGGTQRLPRLVGVEKAIDMMLMVKLISSEEAYQAGLVDAVVPAESLLTEARNWALEIATGRKPWHRTLERSDHLRSVDESLKLINGKRLQVNQMFRNVPHPSACLDIIEQGLTNGAHAATFVESKVSAELNLTPTAKGLMHAFFSERAVFKVSGVSDQGLKARQMRNAAVVGGGLMGSGIVTTLLLQNIPVWLKETDANALSKGINRIRANLESRAKRGGITQEKFQSSFALLKGTLEYKDFRDVDIVIEAAFESVPVKQEIFQKLESSCKSDCILATNTSLIDLGTVGAKTRCQDRLAGTHFFSPAHVMPLLEVVRSDKTSPQVVLDLMNLGKVLKKIPVVVKSSIGFAVNRVFFPYFMVTKILVLQLGVHPYRIDSILKTFGMPMGPHRMGDLAGHDIGAATAVQWAEAFPDRVVRSHMNSLMIKNNRLGEKTGKGFYNYSPGSRKEEPAPEIDDLLTEARKLDGLESTLKGAPVSDEEVLEMIFFPCVNEACRILEEGVVLRASDIDISTILGMGFPRYRGGLLFWGESYGARRIHSQLSNWSSLYTSKFCGKFFEPCLSLQRAAATNSSLAKIVEFSHARL